MKQYVIRIDGNVVAKFGAALKAMAEAELKKAQEACMGTSSSAVLCEE
jgi:hypothetical protein